MTTIQASIAASRFGFGPRPGELALIARDPVGWLRRQIAAPPPLPSALAGLKSSDELAGSLLDQVMRRRSMADGDDAGKAAAQKSMVRDMVLISRDEGGARSMAAVQSDTPFFERLVQFWSNHFTVSTTKTQVRGLAGAFEREAIRPHVLGTFHDLLLASSQHPAMLTYLDQTQSIGPNSPGGQRGGRGLNENLAREIMELHTLGVDGGYTQDDVIAFAKMLTGWTAGGLRRLAPQRARGMMPQGGGGDGSFMFVPMLHEPGPKQFLGRTIAEGGVNEGLQVLQILASHPSTARFVATKLARHFIADEPPESAVRALTDSFQRSGGDLRTIYTALIGLPEVWADPLPKVRTPNDYAIAMVRAANVPVQPVDMFRSLKEFGQEPFAAPSPAGWGDTAHAWLAPEALMRRIETARRAARAIPAATSPQQFLQDTIGPVANADTLLWVSRAPDRIEGIAMVLASPEFQRR